MTVEANADRTAELPGFSSGKINQYLAPRITNARPIGLYHVILITADGRIRWAVRDSQLQYCKRLPYSS